MVRSRHPGNANRSLAGLVIGRMSGVFDRPPSPPAQVIDTRALHWEPGTMYVVAHPDDSLLFQSPTLLNEVRSGHSTVTVHLTAGDDGRRSNYWRNRELGIMAAYAAMAESANQWTEVSLSVGDHQMVLASLDASPDVRVAFMRLPDGGWPDGTGTRRRRGQSLMNLWLGSVSLLRPLDGSTAFDRARLVDTLVALMASSHATSIATMDFRSEFGVDDHPDHGAAARFAREARERLEPRVPLVGYEGYSTSRRPVNVNGTVLAAKKDAFFAYARFDPLAGSDDVSGAQSMNAQWLQREYTLGDDS